MKRLKSTIGIVAVLTFATLFARETECFETNSDQPAKQRSESTSTPKPQRLREGSELNSVTGKFEITGDRVTFYPADGRDAVKVLENLSLERIARELSGIPRERQWRVTGLVTEYQGSNYLLVTHAVLQNQPSK